MNKSETIIEADVRRLRDRVYGQISTDKNWEACKDAWLKPENIKWLKTQKPA